MNNPYQLLINPTQEIILSFEPWLFNTEAYLNLWKIETIKFYWYNTISQKVDALLFLQKSEDGVWISPLRGTFAGIDCDEDFDICQFLNALKSEIDKMSIDSVILKSCPSYFYDHQIKSIKSVFFNTKIEFTELNYHFELIDATIDNHFNKTKAKQLRRLYRDGFEFSRIENPNIADIHDFIQAARNRRGHPMTMTTDEFEQNCSALSDKYLFFCVKYKDKIAALSVCVKLGKGVLYNFYSADNDEFLNNVPMVMLNAGMYEYAFQNQYNILDLGISTYKGIRNEGLIQFKKSLGAIETEKHVLRFL